MSTDTTRLIQAIIGATSHDHIERHGEIPRGPVVTVSRSFGAGGKAISVALAERLGVRCFDREILDAIVEASGTHRYLMEELDEHLRGTLSDWVQTLLSGQSVFAEDYRRHLTNVVLGIAAKGGVIVGRGAYVILADRPDVFRLRVVGSPEQCARRISFRDGITEKAALERVNRITREREQFINSLFKNRGNHPWDFDLTVNSDVYSHEQIVELALAAMEAKGILVKSQK